MDLGFTLYYTESGIDQNVDDRWGRFFGFTRSVGGDLRNTSRQLATGYSCRSQAKRLSDTALPHPLQGLLEVLRRG